MIGVNRIYSFVFVGVLLASCGSGGSDPETSESFTVTATAGSGGNISPPSTEVESGQATALTVTPDTGFSIDSVMGCSGSLSGNTYTTGSVSANCEVVATFSSIPLDTFTVTAIAGAGGSIDPMSVEVVSGETTVFSITPDAGFFTESATGCDGNLEGDNFTTSAITADCEVTATFSVVPVEMFNVTATAGAGGSISPASSDVESGQIVVLTVEPEPGFTIESVTGCNGSLSSGTYTTEAISANCTVTAVFESIDEPVFVRESNTSCIAPELSTGGSSALAFERAFPDLPAISGAMSMAQVPGANTWVLATREGELISFENASDVSSLQTVLDIQSQVTTEFEMGLSGLAFHPSYPSDNRLFVLYNDADQDGRSTVSSFSVDVSTLQASNEQVLFTLPQPAKNHNGGDIAFGIDGYLYISFGDGGADRSTSQDLSILHGSILRIDVDGVPYSVPSDNPFNTGQALCSTGSSVDGDCPEIYAYGFRNPWRFSIDRVTGELWVGDVGENTFEEVNRVVSGGNYGWPIMEANICTNVGGCDTSGLEFPTAQYSHDEVGVSVVAGSVYRGADIPDLVGNFFFGDVYGSAILSVPADSGPETDPTTLSATASFFLVGFEEDADGEIYALDLGGDSPGDAIYRLTGSGGSAQIPENLSETGCFDPISKTAPSGVIPYDVNSQLWSDGAEKSRFFSVPDGSSIDVDTEGDFTFPENTVLVKHFLDGDTYLETRLMFNFSTGWQGYSYEWNVGQTEASLVDGGAEINASGSFIHTVPTRSQCFTCHTQAAGFSLGLEASQQNYQDDELSTNMLEYLNQTYFSNELTPGLYPPMAALDDTSASLEVRARSYLHTNCSVCHRDGGPASYMDLRFSTPLSQTGVCGVEATLGDFGISAAERVTPGNASESILLLRMQSLDSARMPPLSSLLEDTSATQVVADWINGLADCND